MKPNQKNKYKSDFKKRLDEFAHTLEKFVSTNDGEWILKGFIDVYKNYNEPQKLDRWLRWKKGYKIAVKRAK